MSLLTARRYSEFKDRFTPITYEDLYHAKQVSREVLQQQIETTRTNRRNKKTT